mmetsp:Transcript_23796/g.49772  ORF Transcript_23796/g.49772 Transcript_23796/m.49772 type:complete len:105 (+) Transcript_23796:80-394(+)
MATDHGKRIEDHKTDFVSDKYKQVNRHKICQERNNSRLFKKIMAKHAHEFRIGGFKRHTRGSWRNEKSEIVVENKTNARAERRSIPDVEPSVCCADKHRAAGLT